MSAELRLDAASVDQVARRVVERLAELRADGAPASGPELVDAAEVARRFGVTRDWVYEHTSELGAVRLGDGPRPRLRFDPATVAERLNACSAGRGSEAAPEPIPERKAPRQRRSTSGTERILLPIRPPGQPRSPLPARREAT